MQRRADDGRLMVTETRLSDLERLLMNMFTLFRDIESLRTVGVIVPAPEEFSKNRIVSCKQSCRL